MQLSDQPCRCVGVGGDADHLIVVFRQCGDHLLDSGFSVEVRDGEEHAGWYPIGSFATVSEEIQVCTGFSADSGNAFGVLVDF